MINAANAFIDEVDLTRETEHVSIYVDNHRATTVQPLTSDTAQLRRALPTVTITNNGAGIGEGLPEGIHSVNTDALARPWLSQFRP